MNSILYPDGIVLKVICNYWLPAGWNSLHNIHCKAAPDPPYLVYNGAENSVWVQFPVFQRMAFHVKNLYAINTQVRYNKTLPVRTQTNTMTK